METQKLLLADDLFEPIIDGLKTLTIRKGRRDIALGDLIFEATNNPDKQLIVNVTTVSYCLAKNVDDETVRLDGFESTEQMIKEMKRFYPDITTETELTLVFFEQK